MSNQDLYVVIGTDIDNYSWICEYQYNELMSEAQAKHRIEILNQSVHNKDSGNTFKVAKLSFLD